MKNCLNKSNPKIAKLLEIVPNEVALSKILDTFEENYIPTEEEVRNKYNELKEEEEAQDPDNELTILVNKVKLFLNKKLAILQNKVVLNKSTKERQLKKIIDNLESLDRVQSINTFIEDSYDKIKLTEKQFDNLLKNTEGLSRHEMIEKLSSFNDFANGYSILDEISLNDIEKYFESYEKGLKEQGTFSIQDKLAYSILARDKIKQRYLKQGIPLLADFLLEQKSLRLDQKVLDEIKELEQSIRRIESGKLPQERKDKEILEREKRINKLKGFSLDRDILIKQLKTTASDESALDYLFSPLISSEDSVLALFAKSIKSQLENARLESIEFAKEADKAFTKYAKESGRSKDNVANFNKDIYEEIEVASGVDKDGETIWTKKLAFVQKYDVTGFQKAKTEFFKKIGKKPEDLDKQKQWKIAVSEWFRENTQPKNPAEIEEIINAKKEEVKSGIITQDEYDNWFSENTGVYNEEIYFKRELTEPSLKWLNKNWTKIYVEDGIPANAQGEYHSFLVNKYFESQSLLPESFRRGYILPSIEKDVIERTQTSGIKDVIATKAKESIFKQSYDTEYGLAGLGEKDAKFLPVFYTQTMDVKDISVDLISSIMKFDSMTKRYKALNEISGEIALTKQVIGERETIATNTKGEQIIDAFAKKIGYDEYIRKNGESFSQKHLNAFVDMVVYGEMQKSEELFGIEAGKLTNTLLSYSAVTTIAADLLKAVSNNLQGNIQLAIEANSGEFFDKSNLATGKFYYNKSIKDFLSDFNTISPKTLPSQLVDLFDAIQGQFKDQYGRDISGSTAKKLFTTNTLFFGQNAGEHEIQVSMLFSMLEANKVKEKDGTEISLLEAYKKYGIKDIYGNTDFTEDKRRDIQNSLHALNKRLNGVYNDFDKGTAQRYSLGRLAIMYRKHLIPGYKRRFKKLSADQELGSITEGFYRTFWNTFAKDLRNFKFNLIENWSTYTKFEKQQIRRTIIEASFILALTALVMGLKELGDDDKEWKKNYAYNFILYEAIRLRSETASYISPLDAYRVVKSPSAMTSTLERGIKFTDQLLLTWDPEKLKFKRKSGIWNKGDNKSFAYFLKLVGLSGYNFNPEAAIEAFESTLNK